MNPHVTEADIIKNDKRLDYTCDTRVKCTDIFFFRFCLLLIHTDSDIDTKMSKPLQQMKNSSINAHFIV